VIAAFLRRRSYRRAFNAAAVVLIGRFVFETLPAEVRRSIDEEVDRNLLVAWTVPSLDRKWFDWAGIAAERAVAMARLRIPPGIQRLDWGELLAPWWYWAKVRLRIFQTTLFDERAAVIWFDYRPFHQATEDAKGLFRRNGFEIPDFDPPPGGPDPLLDATGLRQRLEQRQREHDERRAAKDARTR
jgi:hypothetical protein